MLILEILEKTSKKNQQWLLVISIQNRFKISQLVFYWSELSCPAWSDLANAYWTSRKVFQLLPVLLELVHCLLQFILTPGWIALPLELSSWIGLILHSIGWQGEFGLNAVSTFYWFYCYGDSLAQIWEICMRDKNFQYVMIQLTKKLC